MARPSKDDLRKPAPRGLTEKNWAAFAADVSTAEDKGGVCQLACKVFRLPDGNLYLAYQYETDSVTDLRSLLAQLIASVQAEDTKN